MDKGEFALLASAIKTYYPKENILPNKQALELWYRELQDIPYKVAEIALREHVHTSNFSPSIAELRKRAAEVQNESSPDWGKCWEQVIMAIRKFGSYREEEALEWLEGLTRECVKRLGFRNICMSENLTAERANFRMIYEQLLKEKEKEQQLPTELKHEKSNLRLTVTEQM